MIMKKRRRDGEDGAGHPLYLFFCALPRQQRDRGDRDRRICPVSVHKHHHRPSQLSLFAAVIVPGRREGGSKNRRLKAQTIESRLNMRAAIARAHLFRCLFCASLLRASSPTDTPLPPPCVSFAVQRFLCSLQLTHPPSLCLAP